MSDIAGLTRDYRAAFQRYLPQRSEAALTAGYEIGRRAAHAEQRRQRQREAGGRDGDAGRLLGAEQRVLLPPEQPADHVALAEAGVAGGNDAADAQPAHDLAEFDRRHVLVAVAHPDAVRGVDREVEHPHEHLAVGRFAERDLVEGEIGGLGQPVRARREAELLGHGTHGFILGRVGAPDCVGRPSRSGSSSWKDRGTRRPRFGSPTPRSGRRTLAGRRVARPPLLQS